MAVNGQTADLGALVEQWRAANDHVMKLEKEEAGLADNPPLMALDNALKPLATVLVNDSVFKRSYQFVPTDVAVVDLNRLVVFQKFINLTFVDELKHRIGANPSPETIFNFALPLNSEMPPVQLMQNAQNMYTLVSPSTDFRFIEHRILGPHQVNGFDSSGHPVTILGISIGYGSNFLNVLNVENRMILGNGSHRAYALRDLGLTHVPCLVQKITRRDELDLVASGDVVANPDRYLKSPRPPMLRDYFDPALQTVVPVYRKNRSVRVQYAIEQSDIPAPEVQ